jgi:hypothetical protein
VGCRRLRHQLHLVVAAVLQIDSAAGLAAAAAAVVVAEQLAAVLMLKSLD